MEKQSIPENPVFHLISSIGNIPERDMYNTFNMGVGMCLALPGEQADQAVRLLNDAGERAFVMGEIKKGETGIDLW